HIEYVLRLDLIGVQRGLATVPHPDGRGIDDDVEIQPLEVGSLDGAGFRLPGEFLSCWQAAIQNEHLRATLSQAEDRRPRCPSRSEHQNASIIERHALLE